MFNLTYDDLKMERGRAYQIEGMQGLLFVRNSEGLFTFITEDLKHFTVDNRELMRMVERFGAREINLEEEEERVSKLVETLYSQNRVEKAADVLAEFHSLIRLFSAAKVLGLEETESLNNPYTLTFDELPPALVYEDEFGQRYTALNIYQIKKSVNARFRVVEPIEGGYGFGQ